MQNRQPDIFDEVLLLNSKWINLNNAMLMYAPRLQGKLSFDKYNLDHNEQYILAFIKKADEKNLLSDAKTEVCMKDVMAYINDNIHNLPHTTATRVVDSLVNKGLVVRYQKPNNRRSVFLRTTSEGYDAIENNSKLLHDNIKEGFANDAQKAEKLKYLLTQLIDIFSDFDAG